MKEKFKNIEKNQEEKEKKDVSSTSKNYFPCVSVLWLSTSCFQPLNLKHVYNKSPVVG